MRGLSNEDEKRLLLSIGSHRGVRPFTPMDVARALNKAVTAGSSLNELATSLHLDGITMVSRFIRLLELDPRIQHLIDWGRSDSTIAFSAASEIARLPSKLDQTELAEAVLKHRFSGAEVKQAVQLRSRSGKPMHECIADTNRMRPQIDRIHVLIGSVVSRETQGQLSQMSQDERDRTLRSAIQRLYPKLEKYGSRMGTDRFTITGNETVAEELTKGRTDFEGAINAALGESVAKQ